jgi:recombinational DNA repair protein (RecF pathway)
MSEIDEETLQMLSNIGATPEEWFSKCCGCEKLITGVVVQRDEGATMCAECSVLAQRNDERQWSDESKQSSISFGLSDEEETLTEYEQMLEDMIDKRAEIIGMKNAGWKQTESGVFYYPDDDNPDIIHLSY